MSDPERSASSTPPDPFADIDDSPDDVPDPPTAPGQSGPTPSLAWDMARMWVREHQKAAMIGAFAVGVLTGAWLRD